MLACTAEGGGIAGLAVGHCAVVAGRGTPCRRTPGLAAGRGTLAARRPALPPDVAPLPLG
jgi:hypothetical protein